MTTMRLSPISLTLASLILAVTSFATAAEPAEQANNATIGTSTRTLLEMQRSGKQAGPELPMLGAASALAYQRYLESHKRPIPATFSTVVGGAGGGQSK